MHNLTKLMLAAAARVFISDIRSRRTAGSREFFHELFQAYCMVHLKQDVVGLVIQVAFRGYLAIAVSAVLPHDGVYLGLVASAHCLVCSIAFLIAASILSVL